MTPKELLLKWLKEMGIKEDISEYKHVPRGYSIDGNTIRIGRDEDGVTLALDFHESGMEKFFTILE